MKFLVSILTFLITFCFAGVSFSQTVILSGNVLDERTGKIVGNASVFEAVQGIGTISNDNGFFRLILEPGKKELKITDNDFQEFSDVFNLTADTTMTIALVPNDDIQKKGKILPASGINLSKNGSGSESQEK